VNTRKQQNLFNEDELQPPMPWEQPADQLIAQIVFNRPVDQVFDYRVPDALRTQLHQGQRVKAPFGQGNRLTVGYCVSLSTQPHTTRQLKSVHSVIDREPLLSPQMLELTKWIGERYLCAWGQVLNSVIPAGVKNKAGTRMVNYFQLASNLLQGHDLAHLSPKQQAVVEALHRSDRPLRAEEITEAASCGTGPITALRNKGIVEVIRERASQFELGWGSVKQAQDFKLNAEQQRALDRILYSLRNSRHETLLLHGVTGSGKTEVYIHAIREVVGYGRQAIVLVPEISLTPQTIRRFRSRFDHVAVLHSHLSDAERHWHWQQIAHGSVQVVVGARSAVFAPTPHLGLIVIDEEHETSFKQENVPRYHAREVARERARQEKIPLMLGSATPTLESWYRAHQKRDVLISLPNRVEQLPLPSVVVVDIRNDPQCVRGEGMGRQLEQAMRRALADKGQVILFLNLRGYSPTLWCPACGQVLRCPACDISLTWHRDRAIVLCHVCDFSMEKPVQCPHCNHPGIKYLGSGTQRLEKEVQLKFPDHKVLRMDSDSMKKPGSHDLALEAFRKGEVSILLGTQMIAKGLDFPNVTLVGVVDSDTSLHQPDLRASERTFQLIAQVAGRTGRSIRGGRVYVQSSTPFSPAISLAAEHDYLKFAEHELKHRREVNTVPYRVLARVIVRGEEEVAVKEMAEELKHLADRAAGKQGLHVRLLGPAPALFSKLKGDYRYHFMFNADNHAEIHTIWRQVLANAPPAKGVEFLIDVDPINLR